MDDGLPKYHMPLEEANKIIESNMKLLEPSDTIGLCTARLSSAQAVQPKLQVAKPRARVASFKSRLGKVMHRLYELEPGNLPEKPLNVDLGVDLYQMEEL
jgi:hypothetical protein